MMKAFILVIVILATVAGIFGCIWICEDTARRDREFVAACPFKEGLLVKSRIDGRQGIVVHVSPFCIQVKFPTPKSDYPYSIDFCQQNELILEK